MFCSHKLAARRLRLTAVRGTQQFKLYSILNTSTDAASQPNVISDGAKQKQELQSSPQRRDKDATGFRASESPGSTDADLFRDSASANLSSSSSKKGSNNIVFPEFMEKNPYFMKLDQDKLKFRANYKSVKTRNNSGGQNHKQGGVSYRSQGDDIFDTEDTDLPEVFTHTRSAKALSYEPVKPSFYQPDAPKLAHNLSRVLFEPNVYHQLQDTRSRVYNFTPFLKNIIPVEDFDFNKINGFIPSGRDPLLLNMAKEINSKSKSKHKKIRFYSSTSSMTGLLCQLHYFLSNRRPPSLKKLSATFSDRKALFTNGAKCAASVIVKLRDSVEGPIYSIDSDKSTDSDIILSILGHSMEKLLVTNEDEFMSKYQLKNTENTKNTTIDELLDKQLDIPGPGEQKNQQGEEKEPETYHYAKIGKFLVRSQLDCYDPRLPNNGTFDLKTRAVCAIRADVKYVQNEQSNKNGYQIFKRLGEFESHEREKYDLIRSTMLKYSFQARIGNMDGIFICYHNIEKIFGFEYVPLQEMDEIFHSDIPVIDKDQNPRPNSRALALEASQKAQRILESEAYKKDHLSGLSSFVAEREFLLSYQLLDDILNTIIHKYVSQKKFKKMGAQGAFRMIVRMKNDPIDHRPLLYVIFAPLTENQVASIDNIGIMKDKLLLAENLPESTPSGKLENDASISAEPSATSGQSLDQNLQVKMKLDPKYYKEKEKTQKAQFYEINKATSEHAMGFKIKVDHFFDNELQDTAHPFPKSPKVDWKVKYTAEEFDKATAQNLYSKFLLEKAALSWAERDPDNEFINTLRQYGKIGKLREKYWSELDSAGNIVWTPDEQKQKIWEVPKAQR